MGGRLLAGTRDLTKRRFTATITSMKRVKLALLSVVLLMSCSLPLLAKVFTPATGTLGFTAEEVGDSVRVIARWVPRNDGKGAIDYYKTFWTSTNRDPKNGQVVAPIDTFMVPRPAPADSAIVRVGVVSVRRNKVSLDTLRGVFTIRNIDTPPLGPDSLKIDTTHVDSSQMVALLPYAPYTELSNNDVDSVFHLAEGDSVIMAMRIWYKPGFIRPADDTSKWSTSPISGNPVIALRPFGYLRDSVMIHAIDCGCRESHDASNPPRLNINTNALIRSSVGGVPVYSKYQGYVVRDEAGGWRPVTPLAADPFRAQ